ncbi:hypothetical protein BC829DRAFT_440958 [Chytridium lagenaria]|nr:hypothetical protein BC829DRAFT_440958 [Chytridium lagenaria]
MHPSKSNRCFDADVNVFSDRSHSPPEAVTPPPPLQKIPKLIWTFWDTPDPPQFIRDCIHGWKRLNPNYTITLITLPPSPTTSTSLPSKSHSNLFSSNISPIGLDEVLEREVMVYNVPVYSTVVDQPVTESWFIATVPQGRYIGAWFNEFNKAFCNFGMNDTYLTYLRKQFGEIRYQRIVQNIKLPGYLKVLIASQKVIEVDGVPPPYSESATEKLGPFGLHEKFGWNETRVAEALFEPWPENEGIPAMVKLRNPERTHVMKMLEDYGKGIGGNEIGASMSLYGRFVRGASKEYADIVGLQQDKTEE